ncbi:hypothetical protein PIB30_004240 [Stylosanthes scabra]|uniref:Uncharacterized protein n=1 Tax=Stylosanthes scabra TaxID=79078 RepID=A0ABU6S3V2_9FABA|nr:hypothetical protein [Stylosanthes scabra]
MNAEPNKPNPIQVWAVALNPIAESSMEQAGGEPAKHSDAQVRQGVGCSVSVWAERVNFLSLSHLARWSPKNGPMVGLFFGPRNWIRTLPIRGVVAVNGCIPRNPSTLETTTIRVVTERVSELAVQHSPYSI